MRLLIIVTGLVFAMAMSWAEMLLDPSLVCKKTRKLRGKLAEICRNESSGLLKEIINGINLGFKECEFQFNNRRWNCTTLRKSMRKILMKDIRETSFVNAITSAGITYSVATACATGKLVECSCDRSHLKDRKKDSVMGINLETLNIQNSTKKRISDMRRYLNEKIYQNNRMRKWQKNLNYPEGDWEWGGCGDNVKFGIQMSKVFLDSKFIKRSDIQTVAKLHNNHVGRLAIRDKMRIDCKCHGLSGSCTMKTCSTKIPSFREIGSYLKERFNSAVKVISSNDGDSFITEDPTIKQPSKYDLVYTEDSPDFCRPNSKTGSLGTIGRECNATSIGLDGCEILCCNRGHYRRTITEKVHCKCVFKWCCEVSCSVCKQTRSIYTCR